MKLFITLFLLLIFMSGYYMPVAGQPTLYEVMTDPVRHVAWSPDGNYLAVATSQQGGLEIYNAELVLLAEIYPETTVFSVSWSPDSQNLVITRWNILEFVHWDATTNQLTTTQIFENFYDPIYALWSPNGEYIAVVNEIDFETVADERNRDMVAQTIVRFTYQISFLNTLTDIITHNPNIFYETRLMLRVLNERRALFYTHPIIWNPDSSEVLLVGSSHDSDDMWLGGGLIGINPQTAQHTRSLGLDNFESQGFAWQPNSQYITVADEAGVFQHSLLDGSLVDAIYLYFDVAVMKWSRDGRYFFMDGALIDPSLKQYTTKTWLFDNSDSETVFTADWHPYRPIIAIGSLNGRLTVEDATRFEGFTASPFANAGESRIVYVSRDLTADVQLDASASVDYDGTITGYEWREGENVLSTNMIADVNLPIGIHDIQLTVTDDDNLTDSVTIQIEAICKTILATESLSDAISELQNQTEYDTICLEAEAQYTLTASLPDISSDITLIGNGAQIVMTGGSRIFNVTATGSLHLKNVALSGGVADDGGAIYNAGDLMLENVTLENHSAVRGGAIYNTGNLVMNGGAIQNNSASQFGGGIYNVGDMQLDGVNIRENTAPEGSGVYQGE